MHDGVPGAAVGARPPDSIVTPRLLLRRWEIGDAVELRDALASSLDALGRWTPWAVPEPLNLETCAAQLAAFREQFVAGADFRYGILDPDGARVLGGAGLLTRLGPGVLEIGYWVRSDAVRRGYATEAAWALTHVAFEACAAQRVEIRCEPDNVASVAVPRRLGYTFRELLEQHVSAAGRPPADLQVWAMTRASWAARAEGA